MHKVRRAYLSKQLDLTLMLTGTGSARMEARHLGIVGGPRLAVESILGCQSAREKTAVFFSRPLSATESPV